MKLRQAFLGALAAPQRDAYAAIDELEQRLDAVVDEARAVWSDVDVDGEAFIAHVAARVPERDDEDPLFGGLRTSELYLACGCALGIPSALAAFERTFGADIRAIARRFRDLPGDDVEQLVREKILVAGPGKPAPRIADYAGLGFLQNWVRITTVRTCLDATRKGKASREQLDSDGLLAVADPDDDVELAYLKRHYRGEFKAAFAEAVSSLSSRERNALRQHLIGGLTIDQLARIWGIHRATAARRIARARETLLAATRRALAARLRVGNDELASIMRLIHSQLDVSFVRLLQTRSHIPHRD